MCDSQEDLRVAMVFTLRNTHRLSCATTLILRSCSLLSLPHTAVKDMRYCMQVILPICVRYSHAKTWCLNRLFEPLWVRPLAAFWPVAMSLQGPRNGLMSAFLPHCYLS